VLEKGKEFLLLTRYPPYYSYSQYAGCPLVLEKGKEFLLLTRYPPYYSYSQYVG
jgi:hypothetical protein